jgi:hypothetical protein
MMEFHGKGAVSLQLESGRIFRIPEVLYVPCMRINLLSISALEHQGYGASFFGCSVHIRSVKSQEPGPPVMIGISEYGLYKLWGQPVYRLTEESNESASQSVREQEAILSRPTWWEWTQLDEWGYSDNPGTGCSRHILAEQIECSDMEQLGLSDSEGETHSEVDPGEDNSSDFTSLAKREC